jgi:hypothetical protein
MEKVYKSALEIILEFCKEDSYSTTKNIKLVCETVLKKKTEDSDCCGKCGECNE